MPAHCASLAWAGFQEPLGVGSPPAEQSGVQGAKHPKRTDGLAYAGRVAGGRYECGAAHTLNPGAREGTSRSLCQQQFGMPMSFLVKCSSCLPLDVLCSISPFPSA